jgi:hypothetical protein
MSAALAYMAGLFDGEGSFSIQLRLRDYKGRGSVLISPKMSMSLTYGLEVLEDLKAEFGGNVYHYDKTAHDRKATARWSLHKREQLVHAAQALLPHLRIKKQIAERFLEALALFPTERKNHVLGERTWDRELTLKVADIAFSLNPGGSGRRISDPEFVTELAAVYAKES